MRDKRTPKNVCGEANCPPPSPPLCGPGPKINMEGGVHAVKIMIHCQYKFLGVIRILCDLRRKTHSIRAFFFWRETEISFITKILAAVGLRSHVTITLRDKSRYDLILKINETA